MADPNLAERLAATLRRDILRGRLAPGDSVKERDNAAHMGVSRTPMREAIRILAKEGLVELRPSRSPVVVQLSYREIEDQTAVLIALEKLAGRLACTRATEGDLARIEKLLQRMEREFDSTDALDMFEIDMDFHTAIACASRNAALVDTHQSFLQRLWRARYMAAVQRRNRERVVTEHSRILQALKSRKPDEAAAAIGYHLDHLAEDIRHVIEEETAARNPSRRQARTN